MKMCVRFFVVLFWVNSTNSQDSNVLRKNYKENFVPRTLSYSKKHYFGRLSHNNQTLYVENLIHPHKRILIFSNNNKGIKSIDFSYDEKFLVSGTNSGTVDVWEIDKREILITRKLHNGATNKVKFLPHVPFFVSAGNDGKIYLTGLDKNAEPILIGKHNGIVRDFDLSQDGNSLASIGSDGMLKLWNLASKEHTAVKMQKFLLSSIKFLSDSNRIVVGDRNGEISFFDTELNKKQTVKIHDGLISSISSFPGNQLITGSFDGSIKKIDLNNFDHDRIFLGKHYIIDTETKGRELTFSTRDGEIKTIIVKSP